MKTAAYHGVLIGMVLILFVSVQIVSAQTEAEVELEAAIRAALIAEGFEPTSELVRALAEEANTQAITAEDLAPAPPILETFNEDSNTFSDEAAQPYTSNRFFLLAIGIGAAVLALLLFALWRRIEKHPEELQQKSEPSFAE